MVISFLVVVVKLWNRISYSLNPDFMLDETGANGDHDTTIRIGLFETENPSKSCAHVISSFKNPDFSIQTIQTYYLSIVGGNSIQEVILVTSFPKIAPPENP